MAAPVIVWFRRDLRTDDNPALIAACAAGRPVVCAYIHAPDDEAPWAPGAAGRVWLARSLAALNADLHARGATLTVRRGPTDAALSALIDESGARAVYWNRLYEPSARARDERIKAALRARGLDVQSFNGALLAEPWAVTNRDGGPCKVFTPFWRTAAAAGFAAPVDAPARIPGFAPSPPTLSPADLGLTPTVPWDAGIQAAWTPGEAGARALLDRFADPAVVKDYHDLRNRPDLSATSRLSPHLHFGEISPRRAVWAARAAESSGVAGTARGVEHFVREVGWREFGHHLLYHFPHTAEANLRPEFDRFGWTDPDHRFVAWTKGRTGYPIVDAGMRELWTTGWMHNRVRMIVASFLVKHLRIHWLHGARWFWDTLVDADLANNTLGWQWTAGSGADAAPYFRIFNPVTQGERFDPDGAYVRRYVPELAALPTAFIHKPWEAPPLVRTAAGLARAGAYPPPIVDHATARKAALAAFAGIKGLRLADVEAAARD